jgi:Fic family protein
MKKPQTPPPFNELIGNLSSDKLQKIIEFSSPIWKNRYLHWHKMQFLTPPNGLTIKDWWTALKLSRLGQLRQIPLNDTNGKAFNFGMPDPALEYLHKIDQNACGHIQTFDKETINTATQDKYIIHSLIEEAITSSQLEGATATRKAAKEMLQTERTPKNKSEQMILNNYNTMVLIKSKTKENLSKELILDLHRHLVENTIEDPTAVGRYRTKSEDIRVYDNAAISDTVLHTPPPADQLEMRINALCDFANCVTPSFYIHPVIRSIILHFWIGYDHPFVDGNGRCARALFYWSMLRQGYWLCEYISISQILRKAPSKYAKSFLYTESDDNNLTYFILYNLSVLVRAIDELHSYIAERSTELNNVVKLLRDTNDNFNHRQLDLLQHAIKHSDAIYTIKGHQKANNIVYETARTDLLSLERQGLLQKKHRGRELVYLPIENIEGYIKDKTHQKK